MKTIIPSIKAGIKRTTISMMPKYADSPNGMYSLSSCSIANETAESLYRSISTNTPVPLLALSPVCYHQKRALGKPRCDIVHCATLGVLDSYTHSRSLKSIHNAEELRPQRFGPQGFDPHQLVDKWRGNNMRAFLHPPDPHLPTVPRISRYLHLHADSFYLSHNTPRRSCRLYLITYPYSACA
jgi:hypothetical protein